MRDRAGAYWCYACGKADLEKKHGGNARIPCVRCGKSTLRRDMVDDRGLHLCQTCGYDRALKHKELGKLGVDLELPHESAAKARLRNGLILMAGLALMSMYRWGLIGG